MTIHNEAKKEDIAKIVLMPGDPLRAKFIAETFLEDYKLVNSVRGMLAYTGKYKDKTISVMAHGMGNPSIAIYAYELYKFYDVDAIIRIGSCGTYTNELKLRDLLLVDKSYSDSSFAKTFNGYDKNFVSSSSILNDNIMQTAKESNAKVNIANVYTTEAFYSQIVDIEKIKKEYNCMAVEMECFALFHLANSLNKQASCILTVSDNVLTKETLTSQQTKTTLIQMIALGLNSIIKY